MPPACALLGMAGPAPHETRPFRFLDLPAEIRCVVYELLADRHVRVKIPDVEFPFPVIDRETEIIDCYYPAMMRVNKQVREEYTTLITPRITLCSDWTINNERRRMLIPRWERQVLPKSVLSKLKVLEITFIRSALSPDPTISLVEPLIYAFTCGMHQLSLVTVLAITNIQDRIKPSGNVYPTGLDNHGQWKREIMDSLEKLAREFAPLTVQAQFAIACALYCPLPRAVRGTIYDVPIRKIPGTMLAVCNGPDTDTFKLDGSDLKFMGVGHDVIPADNNTQVIMTSKDVQGNST